MKKILLLLTLLLCFFTQVCWAEDPLITSKERSFNPLTGVYTLVGDATIRWPSERMDLVISCDRAQVLLYQMEVHAEGNIKLEYDADTRFTCDRVDVYHSDSTAYVEGNTVFRCGQDEIKADKGSYCWKTKLAVFSGHVRVNGKPYEQDVEYNVIKHQLTKP